MVINGAWLLTGAGPGPDVCNLTTPIAGCSRDDVMVAVYIGVTGMQEMLSHSCNDS